MCIHREWKSERLRPSAYLPPSAWHAVDCEEALCGLDGDVCGNPDDCEPWLCHHGQMTSAPCPECAQELLCAAWLEDEAAGSAASGANPEKAKCGQGWKPNGRAWKRNGQSWQPNDRGWQGAGWSRAENGRAIVDAQALRWLSKAWPRLRQTPDGQMCCDCRTTRDSAEQTESWRDYQKWKNNSPNAPLASKAFIVIPTDNEFLSLKISCRFPNGY